MLLFVRTSYTVLGAEYSDETQSQNNTSSFNSNKYAIKMPNILSALSLYSGSDLAFRSDEAKCTHILNSDR